MSPSYKIDIYDNSSHTWTTAMLQIPMVALAGIANANKIYWATGCNVEIKDVSTGNSSTANLFQPGLWIVDDGQNKVLKNNKLVFFWHQNLTNKQISHLRHRHQHLVNWRTAAE